MAYAYAHCQGCGWNAGATETKSAAALLAAHVAECQYENRVLFVPMWSIRWPRYHSPEAEAHRRGAGPAPPRGLEMSWRVVGSHSVRDIGRVVTGADPKTWHLFPCFALLGTPEAPGGPATEPGEPE